MKKKDLKMRAAMIATGIIIGAAPLGTKIALDNPEVVTIIERSPPEIVEIVKGYRYLTRDDMIRRKKELITKVKTGVLTIGGGEFEELQYIFAAESFEKGDIVLHNVSGSGQDIFNAILDMEFDR